MALGLGMELQQVQSYDTAEALSDAISQLEIMGGASAFVPQQLQRLLEQGERVLQQEEEAVSVRGRKREGRRGRGAS